MYLARRFVNNHISYSLCESYLDGDLLRNRDLVDLGEEPQRYIIYPGGNSFYINESLEERLVDLGVEADQDILEELFFPFLDPYIGSKISPFMNRQDQRRRRPVSMEERLRIAEETHLFDRRRLHFLRCGRTDPGRLHHFTSPLFRVLLDKSRDEIEQYFLEQEQIVKPRDYNRYIFTIFDLQNHFSRSYARHLPQALDQDELDQSFIKELCRLDQDKIFWSGMNRTDRLPKYLIRYVVMYFDFFFPATGIGEPFINQFMNSGRRYQPPPTEKKMSESEAGAIFGVSPETLRKMSNRELTKLYRKRAHELHPDKGGDDEQFITLTAAYHEFLSSGPGK